MSVQMPRCSTDYLMYISHVDNIREILRCIKVFVLSHIIINEG